MTFWVKSEIFGVRGVKIEILARFGQIWPDFVDFGQIWSISGSDGTRVVRFRLFSRKKPLFRVFGSFLADLLRGKVRKTSFFALLPYYACFRRLLTPQTALLAKSGFFGTFSHLF